MVYVVSDIHGCYDKYSTSVSRDTIDECPMVYKPMDEIIRNIGETVKVDKIIKPIYTAQAAIKEMQ